jgi:hypothetical protein
MENKQTFTLVFGKDFQQVEYYLGGFDPYEQSSVSQSFGAIIKTKPKKEYAIKKIKGYNRVVNIGWSYIIERL